MSASASSTACVLRLHVCGGRLGPTAAFKDVSDLLVSVKVLLKEALELLLVARELFWRDSDDVLQDTDAVLKRLHDV